MPQDIFIKIGDIQGEAQDKSHKGEIDVLCFNWGVSNSLQPGAWAGKGPDTKGSVTDLSFKKQADRATPDLLVSCFNGKKFDKVTLTVRKAGDKPLEYMVYTLGNVRITSVSQEGKPEDPRLIENVSLNFAAINFNYKEQNEKGAVGATPSGGIDVAAGSVH
jgi:type VI secretion system secreted protein Hcp